MKIYNKIFIGLILGIFFGLFFPTKENLLKVKYKQEDKEKALSISNWEYIEIMDNDLIKRFNANEVDEIINYYNDRGIKRILSMKIFFKDGKEISCKEVVEISKHKSLLLYLKPLGTVFVRLLSFVAIPLVIASLFVGACSLGDAKKLARVGYKTLLYYIFTTIVAISIGLLLANAIKPGHKISLESRQRVMQENQLDIKKIEEKFSSWSYSDFFIKIIPTNPFSAIASGDMLSIIFTVVFLGLIANYVDKEKAKVLILFFEAVVEMMIKCISVIMKLAPYAVFVLIGAVVSEFGSQVIKILFWYILTVLLGLIIQLFFVYPILLKFVAKESIRRFFKSMRPAMLVAFSTSSSAATLPVNMECCEKGLRIPNTITSFVLPLGATINMDGTALYQGIATVFISQLYQINLMFFQYLVIIITAVMASIGTAPVPGLGIIMLMIILRSVGLPEEGIIIILSIDRIIDMCRTVVNISGDAVGASIISNSERYR